MGKYPRFKSPVLNNTLLSLSLWGHQLVFVIIKYFSQLSKKVLWLSLILSLQLMMICVNLYMKWDHEIFDMKTKP